LLFLTIAESFLNEIFMFNVAVYTKITYRIIEVY